MTLVACLFGLWLGFADAEAGKYQWEEIYTSKEVVVSKAEIEGSKFVAFKGEVIYEAPIGKVLGVILDNDHRLEWVGRLQVNRVLEQTTPFDYVVYQAFGLPPLFSDRDYVYRGVATQRANGIVELAMSSVEHTKAPETVGVRADLVDSRYELEALGPNQTRCAVEIVTDPRGSMPAWIVNLIQRTWPRDTLVGIREQLPKAWVTAHPLPPVSP
ncbi:MAG: START domain-containing protein [Myxococcota bacterium]